MAHRPPVPPSTQTPPGPFPPGSLSSSPGSLPSSPEGHPACSCLRAFTFAVPSPGILSLGSILPHHHYGERMLIFRSQLKCHIFQVSHSDHPIQSGLPASPRRLILLLYFLLFTFSCWNFHGFFFFFTLYCLFLLNTLNHKFMRSSAYLANSLAYTVPTQ